MLREKERTNKMKGQELRNKEERRSNEFMA